MKTYYTIAELEWNKVRRAANSHIWVDYVSHTFLGKFSINHNRFNGYYNLIWESHSIKRLTNLSLEEAKQKGQEWFEKQMKKGLDEQ